MAGTAEGGKLAADTIRKRYGEDYFINIGSRGGTKSRGGGFAAKIPCDCDLIKGKHLKRQCAGIKGGRKSRRS